MPTDAKPSIPFNIRTLTSFDVNYHKTRKRILLKPNLRVERRGAPQGEKNKQKIKLKNTKFIIIKKLSRNLQLILAKGLAATLHIIFTISYVIYNKKQKRMLIVIKKLSRRLQLILAKGLAASIAFGFAKGLSLDLAYHNHHRNINLISTYRIFFSFFTI